MCSYIYTKDLQKNHSHVYKKFFASYDLVLSLPHIIRFGHALGKGTSPLTMRQKIPHQLFLGVNISDHGKCNVASIESFDLDTQTFHSGSPYEYIRNIEDIAGACTQVMDQMNIPHGFDIGILTEYPKGFGTSFNTTLFTLLAVMLFVHEKKLPREILQNYSFQYTGLFSDIAFLASYMKYLAVGSAGSCLPFISLQSLRSPVFQIGTVDFSKIPSANLQKHIRHLSRLFEETGTGSGKKPIGWYPLVYNEHDQKTELPLDIAIFQVGSSHESLREKEASLTRMNTQQQTSRFASFAEEKGIDVSLEDVLLQQTDVYGHMSALLYTRLFQACITSLLHRDADMSVQEIIHVLKDMGFYHCCVEHHYDTISLLTTAFTSLRTFPEEICAFLPMTMVKTGGCFLAVIPRHGERKTIERMEDALVKTYGCPAKIVYTSWKEEQEEHGGVLLHQYISQNIFSAYITPGTIQLLHGDGLQKIGEYDAIVADPLVSRGITFDLIKKKMLVHGKKITSKVLCSQSATIDIMLYLLEHIDGFVPNHLFPASAYSKNKNEMISKIILPLQELMMESCNEKMEIICSGTLYERTICLKKKPTCIHLIQHVHP